MTNRTNLIRLSGVATLASILVLAACSGDEDSSSTLGASSTSSSPSTSSYVERAAISDMFEIESSRIALDKAQNAAVRDFAQQMVDDHSNTSDKLRTASANEGDAATLPGQLDNAHQQKIRQLEAADTDDFDRLYVDMQVQGHEEAIALHRLYSEDGEDPALRNLATQTVPVISHHLEEIEQISGNLE